MRRLKSGLKVLAIFVATRWVAGFISTEVYYPYFTQKWHHGEMLGQDAMNMAAVATIFTAAVIFVVLLLIFRKRERV